MSHDEIDRLIQAEIDGEISAEDEARLQQLLAEGPEFGARYRESRSLAALFAAERERRPGPPEGLAERIAARVAAAPAPAPEGRLISFPTLFRGVAAAACLVLLVGAGFWAGQRSTSAASSSFETDVVEKVRQTVRERDLPRDEADRLLDRFRLERERLEAERQEGIRRAAEELESGLQGLVERAGR
ncbi:MAG: hypothetical protein R3F20_17655 [Planctomycetota bacterium]